MFASFIHSYFEHVLHSMCARAHLSTRLLLYDSPWHNLMQKSSVCLCVCMLLFANTEFMHVKKTQFWFVLVLVLVFVFALSNYNQMQESDFPHINISSEATTCLWNNDPQKNLFKQQQKPCRIQWIPLQNRTIWCENFAVSLFSSAPEAFLHCKNWQWICGIRISG